MCFDRFLSNVGRLALACLVGLFGALFAGCAPAAPTREPVTITFAFPEDDAEHYEALIHKFNESHPLITVELRPRTREDMFSLETESADVLWVVHYSVVQLSQQGKLLDLSSLIEQDEAFQLSAFYPGTVDALSLDGQTWAIPYGVDMGVMYYNQDLFDQYDVPYPQIGWTWDDFLERAVAIRDPDAFVFGYGPQPGAMDAVSFIYQHGGRIFDDLENPTRTTFDDPLTIEALEWYARLVHEYDAAPSLNQSSRAYGGGSYAIFQGILAGKVGMWMGPLSSRGGLSWPVKWKMAWGMVPLPSEAQSATDAVVQGYAISSSTAHHDACWEWIAWLSEQVPYRFMPARRSLAESSTYEDLVGTEVALVARASMEHAYIYDAAVIGLFEKPVEAFEDALEDILQGHKTPQEAMDEAQRAAR
jgi:multiple sugar transport system substrate-binding protein